MRNQFVFKTLASFVALTAFAVHAADDLDADPIDFVKAVRGTDSANLKDLSKRLRTRKAELSKASNTDDIRKKREELAKEKAKLFLLQDIGSKTLGKIDSQYDFQRLLDQAFQDPKTLEALKTFGDELAQRKADVSNKVEKPAEVKAVEAPIKLDGSPAHIVAVLSADANNKPVMQFRLDSSDADYVNLSSTTQKNLTTTEVQAAIKDISPKLLVGSQEVVGFDKDKPEAWLKNTAKMASEKIVKPSRSIIKDLQADTKESESDSTAYNLKEELDELQDTKGRKEDLKQVDVNRKVAEWLKSNPAGELTECEILEKAIAPDSLDTLPVKTKNTCVSEDPKFKARAEKEKAEFDKLNAKADKADKSSEDDADGKGLKDKRALDSGVGGLTQEQYQQAVSTCMGMYRQAVMQAQMGSGINALSDAMDAVKVSSSKLLSKALDNGPMGFTQGMGASYGAKAALILEKTYPVGTMTKIQFMELQAELETLENIHAQATAELEQLRNYPAEMRMQIIQTTPKFQKALTYQAAAGALADAARASLDQKRQMNFGNPGGASVGTAGVPVVGGASAGAGNWRQVNRNGNGAVSGAGNVNQQSAGGMINGARPGLQPGIQRRSTGGNLIR